jgi:CubicO group peptidase (beta-lactamase class C family)
MNRVVIAGAALLWWTSLPAQLPDSITRRVDSVFVALDKPTSPGCALGIYNAGEIAYTRGYGSANLEHGIAITPRTVFDLGSTSKQFTAMSVTLLEQDGKLSLDDDVRRWIPELPAYAKPVTIRQLVHHTSGLRDYLTLMWLRGVNFDGVTTAGDALSLIVRQREANFEPGSEYLYSNSGYFLLSEIVRRARGKTLAEFARERIFDPLGMRVTHYHDDHTMIVPIRATGYALRDSAHFQISMSGFEQIGDGSVMTTVEELALWDRNFYDGRVGGRALLEAMHVPARLTSGRTLEYASGLVVGQYRGLRTVRHGGSWAGYRAELLRFPEQRTSVAVLCNYSRSGPGRLAQRVADVILRPQLSPAVAAGQSASPERSTAAPAGTDISRYVGVFRNAVTDDIRTVSSRGDTLHADYGDGELSVLRPLGDGRFAVEGTSWEVRFPSSSTLVEHVPNQPAITFLRFERARPSARELDLYAGAYYSDELDVRWTIVTDSGGLVARIPGGDTLRLAPTVRDTFVGGGVVMKFRRAGGRISGALLHSGRVRNIVFSRVRER